MLAETYLQHNRAEEGLVAVAEAMELMKRTEDHMWLAELARIEGELPCAGCLGQRGGGSLSASADDRARSAR